MKKVISRNPKTFEQSPLEAKISTFQSTSKAPDYSVGNFNFCGNFLIYFFRKFLKDSQKCHILEHKKI